MPSKVSELHRDLKNVSALFLFSTFGCGCYQVKHIEGKGRGVFALKGFQKGDFVVEYHGDLLELPEAKKREAQYAEDPTAGCYMYYFQYQTKTYW